MLVSRWMAIFVLVFLALYFYLLAQTNEFDLISSKVKFGILSYPYSTTIITHKLILIDAGRHFKVTFDNKLLFAQDNSNFLLLANCTTKIKSVTPPAPANYLGDYHTQITLDQTVESFCRAQIITKISLHVSDDTIVMQGAFEDCPGSLYEVHLSQSIHATMQLKVLLFRADMYNRILINFKHENTFHYYGFNSANAIQLQADSYSNLVRDRPLQHFWARLFGLRARRGEYHPAVWFTSQRLLYKVLDYPTAWTPTAYMTQFSQNRVIIANSSLLLTITTAGTYRKLVEQLYLNRQFLMHPPQKKPYLDDLAILAIPFVGFDTLKSQFTILAEAGAAITAIYISSGTPSLADWQLIKAFITAHNLSIILNAESTHQHSRRFIDLLTDQQTFLDSLASTLSVITPIAVVTTNSENSPLENASLIHLHNSYQETIYRLIKQHNDQLTVIAQTGPVDILWHAHSGQLSQIIPQCITRMLSSGLTGHPYSFCEIGSYYRTDFERSDRDQATIQLLRYMQLAAFSPVFMSHQGPIVQSASAWSPLQLHSDLVLASVYAFYSQVFQLLAAYRSEYSPADTKMPMVRALFVELESSGEQIQDQYYLGDKILVCPYTALPNQRAYYLPKGEWLSLWSGIILKGCNCLRQWKDQHPPVFIRSHYPQSQQIIAKVKKLLQIYSKQLDAIQSTPTEEL